MVCGCVSSNPLTGKECDMQQKKIIIVLIGILTTACIVLALNLVFLIRTSAYLPDEAVDDIVAILAEADIRIDPDIISTKREQGTVYVCNSGDYSKTVAELLGRGRVQSSYIIPDGEILLLDNGARFDFGGDFSFRYDRNGINDGTGQFDLSLSADHVSEEKRTEITEIVVDFLDSGSREFENTGKMSVVTTVDTIWENAGVYYALCSRSIDDVAITENIALCTIESGEVTEAFGRWSFLTLGESYSAQLSDLFNILFNVKKEIGTSASEQGGVTIESIDQCYSLYFYGDGEDFCLIPCWQVVTDTMGEFIYNAIDSTLYTKN